MTHTTRIERPCYTATEVARKLGVSRTTVYAAADRDEIPCRKIGRRRLFLKDAIDRWLADTYRSPRPAFLRDVSKQRAS